MKKRLLPLILLGGSLCAQESTSQTGTPQVVLQTPPLVANLPSSGPASQYSGGYSGEPSDPSQLDQYAPFPVEGVYWIQDGGRTKRRFVLSLEEICVGSKSNGNYQSYGPAVDGVHALDLAEELALTTGKKVWPVLYPSDVPADFYSRRLMSDRIHVVLEPGVDSTDVGVQIGAHSTEKMDFLPDEECFFRFSDAVSALRAASLLKSIPGVLYIEPCLTRQYTPHALPIPTDNLYDASYTPVVRYEGHPQNEARTAYQWYLENTGLNYAAADLPSFFSFTADPAAAFALVPRRVDTRARPAWEYTRGANSRINILDTAVHVGHADLASSRDFLFTLFKDYVDDDDNVSPQTAQGVWFGADEFHGTAMAGIMTAQHGNGVANPASSPRELAGMAPLSKFIAQRVVGQLDEVDIVKAITTGGGVLTRTATATGAGGPINYTIYTITGTPLFDVMTYALSSGGAAPQPLFSGRAAMEAFKFMLTVGRNRKVGEGPVVVTAGFNNGNYHGNQNWGELRASGMALVVGGVTDAGRRVGYSSRGANLSLVAPVAGTEDTVADELIPNVEPRIDPGSPLPQSIPAYAAYPPVPTAPMPFTIAGLPPAEYQLQWADIGHSVQVRRAGQTIVTLGSESPSNSLYQRNFEGNSAASAMVAGVASLICSVRPDLRWLDIHEILMRSSEVNQAPVWWDTYSKDVDTEWRMSPTGKPFSHKFGYGVLNAERAVEWAKAWIPLNKPVYKEGTRPLEDFPPRSETPATVTDPQTGRVIVWNRFPKFNGQALGGSPKSLDRIPAGLRIQRILVGVNAPSTTARPVIRRNMGIRLIAPPEREPVEGLEDKPTIISHLMYPALEDIGRGINYWRFSTNHHLGGIYSSSRNLLLHVYGAGASSGVFGTSDGVEVAYIGTREGVPVNAAPGFLGNRPTGRIFRPIGRALGRTTNGEVYRQPAPIGAPPRWTKYEPALANNYVTMWYGGLVPADAANPEDPGTPGFRRVRSPHVMKPAPLPLVPGLLHASYPPPLNVPGTSGYVPLDLPRWRTTAQGAAPGPWQTGMPPGISFDPATGFFSGLPTQVASYQIELTATNMFDFAPAPGFVEQGSTTINIRPGRKLLIDVDFYDPQDTFDPRDIVAYTAWSKRFFPDVEPYVPMDGDEDEDGLTNYFELIAGSYPDSYDDPNNRALAAPYYVEFNQSVSPPVIHFHWTQNFQSIRKFFVETSTDLINWVPLDHPTPESLDVVDSYDYFHTAVPGERRYFRLKDRLP